mgnify:CR=1 FL=1
MKNTIAFASFTGIVLGGVLFSACSSSPSVAPLDDDAGAADARPTSTTDAVSTSAPDSAPAPDAAVAPPGPTEFPAFEGAFVTYANGGKFFGYKGVAKDVDTDSSKVETNVYTAYFNDSGNRFIITLPNRTAGTFDLSATVKVEVSVAQGAERAEGVLAGGKLELVEATDKKIKARFYGDTGGVKFHGAVDATLVP